MIFVYLLFAGMLVAFRSNAQDIPELYDYPSAFQQRRNAFCDDASKLLDRYRFLVASVVAQQSFCSNFAPHMDSVQHSLRSGQDFLARPAPAAGADSNGQKDEQILLSLLVNKWSGLQQGDLEGLLLLGDNKLQEILRNTFVKRCMGADEDDSRMKKVGFHSWGGKRIPKDQSKVVIRTPFHSWGGKRASD